MKLRDQGADLPYPQGFHLDDMMVDVMNPEDLNSMNNVIVITCFEEARRKQSVIWASDQ